MRNQNFAKTFPMQSARRRTAQLQPRVHQSKIRSSSPFVSPRAIPNHSDAHPQLRLAACIRNQLPASLGGTSTDRKTDGYIGHPASTISSIHQRGQPACSLPARLSLTHVSRNASFLASSNHPSIKNLPVIHQVPIRYSSGVSPSDFSQCFHLPMLRHPA